MIEKIDIIQSKQSIGLFTAQCQLWYNRSIDLSFSIVLMRSTLMLLERTNIKLSIGLAVWSMGLIELYKVIVYICVDLDK